jgi:hypothetical protein
VLDHWHNSPWVTMSRHSDILLAHLTPRVMSTIATTVVRLSLAFCILINSPKTTESIWTKLWWNGLQMVLSRNCVRRPRPPIKIAVVTKNRKFVKQSLKNDLLWNYWVSGAQTIVKWSLVVPFQNCVWWSHATCMRVCRHQQT